MTASEGEVVQVCAVLTDVPAGGIETSLTVTFAVDSGTKAGTVHASNEKG